MSYESLKLLYLHFAYSDYCKDYTNLLWLIIMENMFFLCIASYGAKVILSRSSK